MVATLVKTLITAVLGLALAGCGGGGDDGSAPPPANSDIGAAGGTVTGPSGAQVVVPAGALAASTAIGIAQSSAGAPALPAGVTAFGPIFAFTPHGTSFATPVTITVPFDPTSVPAGTSPALYKTNATQTEWDVVPGATVSGSTMSGQVSGFSFVTVAPLQRFPDLTKKTWDVRADDVNGEPAKSISADTQVGGEVFEGFRIGRDMPITPTANRLDPRALVEAFSSDSGKTFWTLAEAPHSFIEETPFQVNSSSVLTQTYTFKKNDAAATLQFKVTRSILNLINQGGNGPGPAGCPWLPENPTAEVIARDCTLAMLSVSNHFTVEARLPLRTEPLLSVGGHAELSGVGLDFFKVSYSQPAESLDALWTARDYDEVHDTAVNGIFVGLNRDIPIDVPLDSVLPGEIFNVVVSIRSDASNLIQGESYAGAFLRDPLDTGGGTAMSFTGLEPLPPREDIPPEQPPQPCTTGPDPQTGTLQFSKADFRSPERQPGARVIVERIGGTKGDVSVLFETADGTALAGSDYKPIRTVVRFKDGLGGQRLLTVPLILDKIAEPDETVNLKLSMFSGCAALGAQATATLTILDDDRPLPVTPTFTIGGTVTGLTGSGLALRNQLGERVRPTANGTYSFAGRQANGSAYTVSVETQPTNPLQVCTVSNGSGTINGGDVTNIGVDCATPLPNGALDASFGSAGKVSNAFTPAKALALQADGKLLALGDLTLSRYNADGSLDAAFGSGGKVAIVANGGGLDTMQALALQADGKIVVAGNTSLPTVFNPDFVVLRYNADGSVDTGFGSGGKVVTDFNGMSDRANAVLVQPDGKIVAVGAATLGTLVRPDQDMALVRYLADGRPDSSFGSGGKVTRNVVGQGDSGDAAVLQADGKIVVAGFVALANGPTDFGIVRFASDGSPDTSFGTSGTTRVDFGGDDRPADLALQADGKIIVAGSTSSGGGRYALLRLNGDGSPDANFGTAGLVSSPFTGSGDFGRAVALQSDGRIVVAGAVGNSSSNSDFGIARYTSAGALDPSFGSGGLVRVDFFGSFDGASDVLIQPDGKIVATGSARNGATTGLGIVRVLP